VDKSEQYRRNALDAMEYAEHARREADRAAWLRIAAKWLALVPNRRRTASERFVDDAHALGAYHHDLGRAH
jgi:hypothetical protein